MLMSNEEFEKVIADVKYGRKCMNVRKEILELTPEEKMALMIMLDEQVSAERPIQHVQANKVYKSHLW